MSPFIDTVPRHRRVREFVLGGHFTDGQKLPSEREMSGQLGVSRMTVRRALDELCRQGFLEGRVGAGTFATRKLSRRATRRKLERICLFHDFPEQQPFFLRILQRLADRCRDVEASLELRPARVPNYVAGQEDGFDPALFTHDADFLFINATYHLADDKPLKQLLRPALWVSSPNPCVPSVCYDWAGETRRAVDHLRGFGHRRIGLLTGAPKRPGDLALHEDSYRQAIRQADLDPEVFAVPVATVLAGEEAITEYLSGILSDILRACTAVYSAVETLARGLLSAANHQDPELLDRLSLVSQSFASRPLSVEGRLLTQFVHDGEMLANGLMDSALAFAAGKLDLSDVRMLESTLLIGESVRQSPE